MDSKLHGLPPNKRFRLIHHHGISDPQSYLPAKKRKGSRDPPTLPASAETYYLPAKKRVWALPPLPPQPDSPVPEKPRFDLNSDYNPSFDDNDDVEEIKEENSQPEDWSKSGSEVSEDVGNGCDDDDDDGIVCAVCQSTDGDPSDPIVLCDGCDLMVHVSCYGSPLINEIPDGEWFCAQCSRKSTAENDAPLACCLCPNRGGAMKPVVGESGKWAHLVCAVFVPEVFFRDSEGREGIDCSKVPKRRWEERCYVCEEVNGCAIHCSEPKCGLAFHVTCGLNEDLCIEYKQGKKRGDIVAGFCKTHTDLWRKQEGTGRFKIVARED